MTKSKYIYGALALVGAAFLSIGTPASAIQLQWSQTYSGIESGAGWLKRPAIDSAGNVYAAYTIHVGGMGTNYDFVIAKYDSAGVLQWSQTLDGAFHGGDHDAGIAVDSAGSIIAAVNSQTSATTYEILLLKFDSAGTLSATWPDNGAGVGVRRLLVGTNSSAGAILLDGNDTIFVGAGSTVNWDATLFKVNANGAMSASWPDAGDGVGVRRIPGRRLGFSQIGLDSSSNVVIGGTEVSGTPGTEDVYVAKYTTTGTQAWTPKTYSFSGSSSDWMYALKVDGAGNIYTAGSSSTAAGGGFMLAVKWLSNGTRDWVRRYNNDTSSPAPANATGIDVDPAGNVYVGGRAPSATPGTFGNTDIAIWRLRGVNGALDTTAWPGTGINAGMRRFFGGETGNGVGAREVRVSPDGNYVHFTGGIRINPIGGNPYSEAFTGKIQISNGATQWTETFTSPGAVGSYGLGISLSSLSPGFFYVQGHVGATSTQQPTLFRYNY